MSDSARARQQSGHGELDADALAAQRTAIALRVSATVPALVRHIVRYAIEQGDQPRSVSELAAAMGMPRKSLDRRLSETITLSARQLLGWGRLLAVAGRLADPSTITDRLARELDFASPSALRGLLQRYAGLTPTQLRNLGTEYLVVRLLSALRG